MRVWLQYAMTATLGMSHRAVGEALPESTQEQKSREATGPAPGNAIETGSSHEASGGDIARLRKAVWVAAIVFLALLTVFGTYYYFDRYVAGDDRSPLEMGIEELEAAVRSDPGNPDTRLALAEVYIARSRYEDALGQAGEVLEEYPDNERALLVLGIAHEASSQFDAAIAVLGSFIDLRKDAEMAHVDSALEAAYFYLGRSYLAAGRPQEAAAALDAALAISPGDADAMHQAGLAHQALGDHDQALLYFERATTFVPDFTEVYAAMAASYEDLEDPVRVQYAQAMQLYSIREYEPALSELLEVTVALPEFAAAYLGVALTFEQLGGLTAGIEAAERALEIRPDYLAAEQTLGRLLQQQGAGG